MQLLQGPVDRAAEQRAIGLLGDATPPDRLNDQQLRQRLNVYRSALSAGNLSEATEQALIQRLNGEIVKALNSPDMKKRLDEGGVEPVTSTPEEFAKFLAVETPRYAKIVKDANIPAQ